MKTNFPIFNGPSNTPHKPTNKPFITVRNQGGSGGPVEILISGPIGKSYWDDSGISEKEFTDALNAIPQNKEIVIGINSEGGSVQDGLGIYNAIKRRRGNITARIDGYAVSIASVIPLAAKRVISPKSSIWMIHDPWSVTQGTSDDHRKAADMLDTHAEVIVAAYEEKTGKKKDEIRAAMKAETWMSGDEAAGYKLADELTEDDVVLNTIDLSSFRRVPGALAQMHNSAALNSGAKPKNPENTMNRDKILALLKKHGATVDNAATDEQLEAQLEAVLNQVDKPKSAPSAEMDSLKADIENLKKIRNDERKAFVSQRIQNLVIDGKVAENEKEFFVKAAMTDDTVIDMLSKREAQKPGADPVAASVDIRADASISDISRAFQNNFKAPTDSFMRGNSVPMLDIRNASIAKANFYRKHKDRLSQVLNTNTVDTELKRNTILQEIIVDFTRRLAPLNMFSTVFQNVPLLGTNKVQVPFYDLDTSSSTAFVSGTGYTTIGNTTTDNREITVGEGASDGDRLYQALSFSSQEIARQPYLNILQLNKLKAEKLANDIFVDVLSIVTLANYGAAGKTTVASMFDSDDIADLKNACKLWPAVGRGLMLDSAYDANLLKDPAFKSAMNAASDLAIKEGRLYPRVMGFDYTEIPTIPSNSEALVGFAFHKSAILVATAPVPPVEEVRAAGTVWELVTDPQTGISFEYRRFGNSVTDAATNVVECSYGFAKGNGSALKRVTSS